MDPDKSMVVVVTPPGSRAPQLTMEVQMALLEAFLRGFPDLASLHLAESVGITASVVRLGGPGHLGRLASHPGGRVRTAEET